MKARRSTRILLMAAGLAVLVSRCSDYTPSEHGFRLRVDTFIVPGAAKVVPQYANQDVDCMYGEYSVPSARHPDDVFAAVERRAAQRGWHLMRREGRLREFHRVQPAGSPSYEVVRMIIPDGASPVHLAWLQMDGPADPQAAARSHEWRWAATNFWPGFDQSLGARR